ncbi:UDP-N-acetylglucosamine/UDP-N-acetylgalactosaminediphosphorylase [Lachnospiraceae bacterium XBB1006]|nr:UDP-N-acetylglucosamine/UDP-N-acetylgalactosaminediphosphorylase [Lachnospiraceae bacterium XBB1006]
MTYAEAEAKCKEAGQLHLLKFYEELSEEGKRALVDEIAATDFSVIKRADAQEKGRGKITPIKALTLDEIWEKEDSYRKTGLAAIKRGEVGAVLLAGGMGTRLGSDNPKGMYNIGLTKEVYIFQRLIENLMDVVEEADAYVHLFIMTSDKNHEKTMAFFEEKDYFGYKKEYIHFFKQDMAPATDYDGKIYLEQKGKLATSPNGNGGWFGSLYNSGLDMCIHEEGIKWLNVFAVDNVLQRMADPVFVGATIEGGYVSGSKVIRKAAPDEKVGVICLEDGRPSIVEYYELTEELMNAKDEKGEPAYNFGVILNYLFRVDALEQILTSPLTLHVVEKKIPCIDEAGNEIKPTEPNGHKYETLILDMVHMMENNLPFEVAREKEFAPIKNKTGIDSVESARELCKKNGIEL